MTENTYFWQPYLKNPLPMFFFRAMKYSEYHLFSRHKRGHGIHSPFVFDLVSFTFRNKIDPDIVFVIEKIRNNLLSDRTKIAVTDLGAGSVKTEGSVRNISDIADCSALPLKYCLLLANLTGKFGGENVIELGTSLGISAMYMAAVRKDAIVHTIEGCPALSEIASENFKKAGLENIRLWNSSFDDKLPGLLSDGIKPGLVFIDGNHRKDAVLGYIKQLSEVMDNESVIVIDDIYLSKSMSEAWSEIKKMKNVTVTIDLFRMGLVFFKKFMPERNYVIRY